MVNEAYELLSKLTSDVDGSDGSAGGARRRPVDEAKQRFTAEQQAARMKNVWATFKDDPASFHQRIKAAMEAEDLHSANLREEEARRQQARERTSAADPDGGTLEDRYYTTEMRGGWIEHVRLSHRHDRGSFVDVTTRRIQVVSPEGDMSDGESEHWVAEVGHG